MTRLAALLLLATSILGAETHWEGAARREGKTWPVAMTLRVDGDQAEALVDLPAIHAYARPFRGTAAGGRIHIERISPGGAKLQIDGTMSRNSFQGTWTGFGIEADLELRPRAPLAAHREEAVQFRNGDVTLSGTIVLPPKAGRYPAVVFAHGGGAQTRQQDISSAVYLSRNGIAALVYDKRGTGQSTGEWQAASMQDLAGDLLAGVAVLGKHREMAQVGVSGYSQGGSVVSLAASQSSDIRFVIAGGLAGAKAVWAKVRVPVWVFWGDRDTVVPVGQSRELVAAALAESGNPDFTMRLFPGIGHDLLQRPAGWDFPRGLQEHLPEIVAWIHRRSSV